ncbi:hypothetical protein O6H91_04G105500 [Diphasiastrum complanatum]|uniref:Uncharacterized protein n=1 Tax=Diphasiastrum complanatum TaxID=34168 RepID=A0ACC2E0D9_DIPCM|nr:hypothetical protein O6H91_04G105500 [Diphasiastrum complanatum]
MDALYGEYGEVSPALKWRDDLAQKYQYYLDKSAAHLAARWLASSAVAAIYVLRFYYLREFYIIDIYVITFGLGIHICNLLSGFPSPQVDMESEGPSLPSKGSDEFKPFVRHLPEFKLWYAFTKAFCVAFVLTFLSIFDVPVFWPILLLYWAVLFALTMNRYIKDMIKYKYFPFSFG